MKDLVSIIISIASFFTAVASLYISRRASLISQGEIEFQMATIIKDANYRVADLGLIRVKHEEYIKSNLNSSSSSNNSVDDRQIIEALENDEIYVYKRGMHEQAIETMLNVYDEACAKYLDGKVDKERFRRSYHKSIRHLVESGEFENQFNTPCSSYKCILRVYDKWFNLEK